MTETIQIRENADGKLVADYRFTADRRSSQEVWTHSEASDAALAAEMLRVPKPGKIYMVGKRYRETDDYLPQLLFRLDNGLGWAGNSNPDIHRYHGWRGTTNGWGFRGLGLRRCLYVRHTGIRSRRVMIIFGRDLAKDRK